MGSHHSGKEVRGWNQESQSNTLTVQHCVCMCVCVYVCVWGGEGRGGREVCMRVYGGGGEGREGKYACVCMGGVGCMCISIGSVWQLNINCLGA